MEMVHLQSEVGMGPGVGEGAMEQQRRKSHPPAAGRTLLLYFKTISIAALHLGYSPQGRLILGSSLHFLLCPPGSRSCHL